MGTNPAEVKAGPRQGLRVLGEEEELARKLVKSLDEGQRKKAVVQEEAPKDILSLAARKAKPLEPAGILMPDLNAEQKELLNSIIVLYAERLRPELAGNDLGKILKAGVDKIGFAWAGEHGAGQAALLPHPGADVPDRVRQHPEQRQPRPQRLAQTSRTTSATTCSRGITSRRPPSTATRSEDKGRAGMAGLPAPLLAQVRVVVKGPAHRPHLLATGDDTVGAGHEVAVGPAGRLFAASPSMTSAQPLKIMSIPTNRPITQSPDSGHCRQMATPRSRLISPCRSSQARL